ncbi:MAG TPA: thiol-activated cytolysin family protein [Allocoleopsis sp.]
MIDSLDQYINALDYDPRLLLSLPPVGSTESIPAPHQRNSQGNGVVICTLTPASESRDLNDIVILNPGAGVIFPGALVLANQSLAQGTPTPIALPRSPMTISIDLPGLADRRTIQGTGTQEKSTISNSDVQLAINQLLEIWNQNPRSQGYTNVSSSQATVQKAYSSEQIALALGFTGKWAAGNAAMNLNVSSNSTSSSTTAFYKQVYYTVIMDTPPSPGSVFGSSVKPEHLMNSRIDKDNPPAYVRSVSYGRLVMITMTTNYSETEANLEGAMQQAVTASTTIGASLDAKYKKIIENSTFSVVTLGGNPNNTAGITSTLNGLDALPRLSEVIKNGAAYSRENPGTPIAYTVAFLKDNRIATISASTRYIKQECISYPNGFVRIAHSGGYVARFSVTWKEPDSQGAYVVSKRWDSGNQTAGYSQTISLPGDARDIVIRGEAATGLVWSPWGEIMNVQLGGPDNKTYTAKGTTLNRSYAVS